MRRIAALVGTVALALGLLAGCGSDSSSSEPLSQQQLDASLLTQADLGSGWQQDTSDSDSGGSGGAPSCLQDPNGDDTDHPEAEATFAQGQTTVFNQQVTSIGKEAKAEFDDAKKKLDDCQDLTATINGQQVSGSITPIDDFPKAGDQSAAYTMTLTDGEDSIEFALAIVRKGGADMVLLYGGASSPDQATFADLVTKAADKVGSSNEA